MKKVVFTDDVEPLSKQELHDRVKSVLAATLSISLDHAITVKKSLFKKNVTMAESPFVWEGEESGINTGAVGSATGDVRTHIEECVGIRQKSGGKASFPTWINSDLNGAFEQHKGDGNKEQVIQGIMNDQAIIDRIEHYARLSAGTPIPINNIDIMRRVVEKGYNVIPVQEIPLNDQRQAASQGTFVLEFVSYGKDKMEQVAGNSPEEKIAVVQQTLDMIRERHPFALVDDEHMRQVCQIAWNTPGLSSGLSPQDVLDKNAGALLSMEIRNLQKLQDYIASGLAEGNFVTTAKETPGQLASRAELGQLSENITKVLAAKTESTAEREAALKEKHSRSSDGQIIMH